MYYRDINGKENRYEGSTDKQILGNELRCQQCRTLKHFLKSVQKITLQAHLYTK